MKTRREFLLGLSKAAGSAALGYAVLPVLNSCMPTSAPLEPQSNSNPVGPDGRVAVLVSDVTPANPYKVAPGVTGPDGMGVVITLANGVYHAFSQRCTHASCPVDTRLDSNRDIHCSCHGSLFALDGSVVQGPATAPLTPYDAIYDQASQVLHIKLT